MSIYTLDYCYDSLYFRQIFIHFIERDILQIIPSYEKDRCFFLRVVDENNSKNTKIVKHVQKNRSIIFHFT